MTTSDDLFLVEGEDFQSSCESSVLDLPDDSTDDTNSTETSSRRVGDVKPLRQRRLGIDKKKTQSNLEANREHEKAKDRQRRAAYRERRRIERESLQQQVTELTAKLLETQKTNDATMPISAKAWKLLAQGELQARLRSEMQQRRLWAEINAHSSLVQDVYQRLAVSNNQTFDESLLRHEPCDSEIFKVLIQDLDRIYSQTSGILNTSGVDENEEDWGDSRELWKEDGETGYHVYTNKRLAPVDFQQICLTLWTAVQLPHRPQEQRQHFVGVKNPTSTAAFTFSVSSGRVMQRCVNRQYQDGDRLVVVWRSFLEGEGQFGGMHADETGWIELTPSKLLSNGGTLTRTCVHHIPMHFSGVATQEPAVEQFTDTVLKSVADDGDEITRRFEGLHLS